MTLVEPELGQPAGSPDVPAAADQKAVQPTDTVISPVQVFERARTMLDNAVDMVAFSGRTIASLPTVLRYGTEVLRQTGIMILSSGLVIWVMELVIGAVFAVQGHYITSQFGARGYVAIFPAYGGLRATAPEMWGWILSAKVGCGIVAEIGSMRITEEIDALDVMGIDSRSYLLGTRLLAAWIAMPFLYLVGLGISYLSASFVIVDVLHSVSPGGYSQVFWSFQSPLDLLFSLIWTMILGTVIVLVACYYGFHAKGGPVGVGTSTAKSMVVNMVVVSLVGMICQQLFWGGFPNAPIGN